MNSINELIALGREKGASDLHLEPGSPSVFRIRGELVSLGEVWTGESLHQIAKQVLGTVLWEDFTIKRSADLSKTISGTRCRINCFQTIKGISFSIRLLSSFKNNLRACNLIPDLKKLIEHETGLILVSGPTGSGKSTTLAALIEEINSSQKKNIITVESPIEYFYQNKMSFIRQREIPHHSPSFEQAITDSMREDPDVLIIGEMRTPDVMRLTLNAAETGHLVLATVHSSTCAEAVSRLCMSFTGDMQPSIRAQIADCLVAVVCQRLTYLPQYKIQVPVLEIMMANSAVKSGIRQGNLSQLNSAIQTGGEDGMWAFDRYRRWVDAKKDWVRPSDVQPLDDHKDMIRDAPVIAPLKVSAPSSSRPKVSSPSVVSPSQTDRIEISVADDDLEELAKKIAEEE